MTKKYSSIEFKIGVVYLWEQMQRQGRRMATEQLGEACLGKAFIYSKSQDKGGYPT